jgi:ferredoxin-NADP reductase
MAMLRHRAAQNSTIDTRLLISARRWEDIMYRDELGKLGAQDGVHSHYTLTRDRPDGWTGFDRRIDAEMLASVGPGPATAPRIFVCGPTPFVERAADLLVELGYPPDAIHAERFGPTGG